MASIYDAFADSCGALAAKAKSESDKVRLLQLLTNGARFLRTAKDRAKNRQRLLPPLTISSVR
jgi:hypothetical protein